MPRHRNFHLVLIVGALAAVAVIVGNVGARRQTAVVRAIITSCVLTNGFLDFTVVATNSGSVGVIWFGDDTPFSNIRWLSPDGWTTARIPNGSKSSLGILRPGESFQHSFQAPPSARSIQAIAHFDVFSSGDRFLDRFAHGGILSEGSSIAEWIRKRSQQREEIEVSSDEMVVVH